jgi:hypothetical protein
VARALARPIDLLITDVGSSINGVGLARALSASHPGMKVLLMSARDLSETAGPRRLIAVAWIRHAVESV